MIVQIKSKEEIKKYDLEEIEFVDLMFKYCGNVVELDECQQSNDLHKWYFSAKAIAKVFSPEDNPEYFL